jgi:LuxR family quorum-sensing system transcriptional regulator SolR
MRCIHLYFNGIREEKKVSSWQLRLSDEVRAAANQAEVFRALVHASQQLGFEYCSYLSSSLLPFTQTNVVSANNFSQSWRDIYSAYGNRQDPVVAHCRRSNRPVVWSDELFAQAPTLLTAARACGLRVAWSQGVTDPLAYRARGIVTLARNEPALSADERFHKEPMMTLLATITHEAMLRVAQPSLQGQMTGALSERESEVLRWTGVGKTTAEIATILSLSENTIKFHVKNATSKLQTNNKTAAVVKAALLGLLH